MCYISGRATTICCVIIDPFGDRTCVNEHHQVKAPRSFSVQKSRELFLSTAFCEIRKSGIPKLFNQLRLDVRLQVRTVVVAQMLVLIPNRNMEHAEQCKAIEVTLFLHFACETKFLFIGF